MHYLMLEIMRVELLLIKETKVITIVIFKTLAMPNMGNIQTLLIQNFETGTIGMYYNHDSKPSRNFFLLLFIYGEILNRTQHGSGNL